MKAESQIFVNGQVFIPTMEACRRLNISKDRLYYMIDNGTITWHKKNNLIYLSKKEITTLETYFENIRNNYYLTIDVAKLINLTPSSVIYMCRKGVFPNLSFINKNMYILKTDVDNYVQKLNDLKENYYTVEEASNILNIDIQSIRRLIKKDCFPNMLILAGNNTIVKTSSKLTKFYIPKSELHIYINENAINDSEYLTISKTSEIYHISRSTLIDVSKFPNSRRLDYSKAPHMVSKEDIKAYLQRKEFLKDHQLIESSAVAFNFFLHEADNIFANSLYPETSQLYIDFVYNQLKKSKERNKKNMVGQFINAYNCLLKFIHKEFYLFTNNELKLFFKGADVFLSYSYVLVNFLKHCKSEKKNDCLFTEIPTHENGYNSGEAREIISPNVFFQYREHVTDLAYHIPKALQKPRHAQIWIFITMHLFEAWRAGDIVSIPNINLDQIGVLDLDYFNHNPNGLSTTQAEIILQQYYVHEFIINKTVVLNNFNVPKSFVIPLATALVIAEIHRQGNKQNCIMYNFQTRYPNKKDYLHFFKGQQELTVFSNIKICRTLLSVYYEWLSEKSNLQGLAHEMSRRIRGHMATEEDLFLTDTTSIYIQDANNDEKRKNFSKHVFERGIYGWLYHTLLLIAVDEADLQHRSLEDKTTIIVSIQNKQSPFQIEGLGKFLLKQQEKKKTLINELRNMPKSKLLDKIRGIYEGIMPSRVPESQCFKYGECPHPKSQEYCKRCEYLIPNKHFLISLKNEIYDLFNSYENLKKNAAKALHEGRELNLELEKLKLRQILWDYMTLIQEALSDEHGLGRDTVDAYIDLNDLLEHLGKIR